MKKRVFAALMAAVTVAGLLAGCGGGSDAGTGGAETGEEGRSSTFTAGMMNSVPVWRLCIRKLKVHPMTEQ